MDAPAEIVCMECGGSARLLSVPPPDDDFEAGDVVAYVCTDCNHRIDMVLDEGEEPDTEQPA